MHLNNRISRPVIAAAHPRHSGPTSDIAAKAAIHPHPCHSGLTTCHSDPHHMSFRPSPHVIPTLTTCHSDQPHMSFRPKGGIQKPPPPTNLRKPTPATPKSRTPPGMTHRVPIYPATKNDTNDTMTQNVCHKSATRFVTHCVTIWPATKHDTMSHFPATKNRFSATKRVSLCHPPPP